MFQSWLQQHGLLILIIIAYVFLTGLNSMTIPLSKAPDEYVHFLYSRFIVENGRLPATVGERQTASYKSDQPPLYYGLLALTTGRIDPNGPELKMTWDSPRRKLADIILPRGMIVRTDDESWPYRGLVLVWFAGRWLSVALSAVTVVLVYVVALKIFPNSPQLALAAAAVVAFTPAYLFISSVLNDDNLVGLISALFFLLLVMIANGHKSFWLFIGLGALMGLAITTKNSMLVLPLETAMALALIARYRAWGKRDWIQRLVIALAAMGLTAGWWFIFIGLYFNEIDELGWPLGLIKPVLVGDASDPTLSRLSSLVTNQTPPELQAAREPFYQWLATFFIRFWETPVFGAPPLYPPIYTALALLLFCGLSLYGLWRIWRAGVRQERLWLQLLTLHLLIFILLPLVRYFVSGKIHDTAQARHLLFPAAPAFGILLVWGMARATNRPKVWPVYLLPLALLGLSAAQLYYFNLAFPPRLPVRAAPGPVKGPAHLLSIEFADGLELVGYDQRLRKSPAALEMVLYWRALDYAREDYLTELSLIDDAGRIAAQTVAHPAHGRYPTRAWDPGDTVYDTIALPLAGVAPGQYKAQLRLLGWDAPLQTGNGQDRLILTRIALSKADVGTTSPTRKLDGQVLAGFDLWQGGLIAPASPTYRYLADIPIAVYSLSPEAEARLWLVGPDGQPQAPVARAGSLQTFIVDYNWPSGTYALQAELWQGDLLLERVEQDKILTVENRSIPFEIPPMGHRLEANFDNKVLLLGYDLASRRIEAGEGVSLVLYWQALTRMRHSYVIFSRLLDAEQQVWGGYDRLPQETYSTILWVPGEVVTDGFIMPVAPHTPDGVYYVVLGLYREGDQNAVSLPLVQEGAPTGATRVMIGPVKVGGPPPETVLTPAKVAPQVPLSIELGDPPALTFLGYDLIGETGQPIIIQHPKLQTQNSKLKTLNLKLYWQSLAQTEIAYTRFVHLRDEQGRTVAQSDGPPGGNIYPTSLWEPGEMIADEVVINLPEYLPPAGYTLAAGVYDPATGQRLFVPGSTDNSLFLTTIELP